MTGPILLGSICKQQISSLGASELGCAELEGRGRVGYSTSYCFCFDCPTLSYTRDGGRLAVKLYRPEKFDPFDLLGPLAIRYLHCLADEASCVLVACSTCASGEAVWGRGRKKTFRAAPEHQC